MTSGAIDGPQTHAHLLSPAIFGPTVADFAEQATIALSASNEATILANTEADATDRGSTDDAFSSDLATLSGLIRANVGLRFGTVDLGGWELRTDIGTPVKGDMRDMLSAAGGGLAMVLGGGVEGGSTATGKV